MRRRAQPVWQRGMNEGLVLDRPCAGHRGGQWWVGRVMAPQNVHILIPGAWEGKGDFADGMKLRF